MSNLKISSIGIVVMIATLLTMAGGLAVASEATQMTPELAAKKENFRKQNEQRITDGKRRTAAEALKAERLKVYRAKRAFKQTNPHTNDNK